MWEPLRLPSFIWHKPVSAHKKIGMKQFTSGTVIKREYFCPAAKINISLILQQTLDNLSSEPGTKLICLKSFHLFHQINIKTEFQYNPSNDSGGGWKWKWCFKKWSKWTYSYAYLWQTAKSCKKFDETAKLTVFVMWSQLCCGAKTWKTRETRQ